MYVGYVIGPAGSGKTHLTSSLYEWMNLSEYDVVTLNLDPGVIRLPYAPDIDVRNIVSASEMIDEFDLGPNGGLVAAMDQVALRFDEILREIEEYNPKFLLVDTPGQMEIFAYRSSGPLIMHDLSHRNEVGGLFMMDPTLASTASSFISVLMLGLSVQYRLNTGMHYIVSKADLLTPESKERVLSWGENAENLFVDLYKEKSVLNAELARRIGEVLVDHGGYGEFPLVSAETNENVDMALGMLERIWAVDDATS